MENIGRIVAILPIGKIFDRVFAEGLKPCAVSVGAELSRVEPEFSSESTLGAICQSLEGADLVIADITARNPHVMYLAGYTHGLGRKLIFIAQHGEDFPFDRTRHTAVIYGSDPGLLKDELSDYLRSAPKSELPAGNAREQFIATFGDLMKKHGQEHRGEIHLENPTTFVLVNQELDLALVQDLARRGRELGIRIKLM